MSWQLVEAERLNWNSFHLRVRQVPCWLARRFGYRTRETSYVGNGTVWYSLPGYRRVGPSGECVLGQFWQSFRQRRRIKVDTFSGDVRV